MFGKNQYDFQLVIGLDSRVDIQYICDSVHLKRYDKADLGVPDKKWPDQDKAVRKEGGFQILQDESEILLSRQVNVPDDNRTFVSSAKEDRLTKHSRIYLVGHGNPKSTHIGIFNGDGYTTDATANLLKSFIPAGVKVKRLVLLCCYAGGNRFGDDNVNVGTLNSFAVQLFSKVADCVGSISARNARAGVGTPEGTERIHSMTRNSAGKWTQKDPGSKILLSNYREDGRFDIAHPYGAP